MPNISPPPDPQLPTLIGKRELLQIYPTLGREGALALLKRMGANIVGNRLVTTVENFNRYFAPSETKK